MDKISIKSSNILGDTTYGSHKVRNYITNHETTYTIPPKSNAKAPWNVDWYLYKERHLVECFFNKTKHFRRIATRYVISWHLLFSLCVYRCHFSINTMNNSF
ncbi:transposase [Bacillus thuringiensis Sbt003]|uniref:Transposase n=1 Tax=Bacillus thuringiensis Sbt003 TaxID=1235825 RepID=A0A9X0K0U7_BACTU|nr:transposase [Bacillus thuringiensis Sbt003]